MAKVCKRLKDEKVGQGRRSSLHIQTFDVDGEVHGYDVYNLRNSAGVIPLDAEGNIYLIEEFAPGPSGWVLSIARGGIDAGETPQQAAIRELKEEAGLACQKLEPLWSGYAAANASSWHVDIFVGYKAVPTQREGGDEIGEVNVIKMTLQEAVEKVAAGKVESALTALAILALAAKEQSR